MTMPIMSPRQFRRLCGVKWRCLSLKQCFVLSALSTVLLAGVLTCCSIDASKFYTVFEWIPLMLSVVGIPTNDSSELAFKRQLLRETTLAWTSTLTIDTTMTCVQESQLLLTGQSENADRVNVNAARHNLLSNYCQQTARSRPSINSSLPFYNYTQKRLVKNLYVDDKHKFLFCKVPKAGISNWKRVFVYMRSNLSQVFNMSDEQLHSFSHYDPRLLTSYSPDEIEYRLKTYMKIIFVRHPLDRLLSAYRDKFAKQSKVNKKYFFLPHGRKIIRKYRVKPSQDSARFGHDVQFDEFLQYVSDTPTSRMDKHWTTYEQLCHPCHIHYDFIGKHETMSVDADYLLNMWRVNVHFPTRYRSALDEFCEYTAAYAHIAPSLVDRLYDRYHTDAAMFAYAKHPTFDGNILCCNYTTSLPLNNSTEFEFEGHTQS